RPQPQFVFNHHHRPDLDCTPGKRSVRGDDLSDGRFPEPGGNANSLELRGDPDPKWNPRHVANTPRPVSHPDQLRECSAADRQRAFINARLRVVHLLDHLVSVVLPLDWAEPVEGAALLKYE